MFAVSNLIVALTLTTPHVPAEWPPRTSIAELNAMVKAGNYHLIRKHKAAHQIEAVGVVQAAAHGLYLKLSGGWSATLHNVLPDHGLKPGDRVSFRALIVDECYENLQLWTYSWKKETGQSAETPRRPR